MSRRKSSVVATLLIALVLLNCTDAICTMHVIMKGVEESNPFMRWLIELHPVTFITVKMLLGPLTGGVLWTFRSYRVAQVGAVVAAGVYFLVCAWHVYGLLTTGIAPGI